MKEREGEREGEWEIEGGRGGRVSGRERKREKWHSTKTLPISAAFYGTFVRIVGGHG